MKVYGNASSTCRVSLAKLICSMKKSLSLPDSPIFPLFLALLISLSPHPASAAFGFRLDGTLNKNEISRAYFEGDFRRILPPLEAWRTSRATKTHEDSIFVYKYLSVIYAADSSTRNKAESYMVQLLKLMPTIELVDMYISDNIEAIFKDVQGKYIKQQLYIRDHNELGQARIDSTINTPKTLPKGATVSASRSTPWIWWTVGGVGLAAVIAGSYFVLHDESQSPSGKAFKL
jgi:hypothetical protein